MFINYTMSATQCQCTNGPLLSFKRSSLIVVGSENTKVNVQRHDSENTRPRPAWTWNGKKAALETHTVQQLQALKHSMIRCFSFQTGAYVCACGLWQCFPTLKQQRINLLHGRRHTLYIWSCNSDIACGKHLHCTPEVFDSVWRSRMKLGLVAGNGPVVLSELNETDLKRHGAHCQHIDNLKIREPHLKSHLL